MPAIETGLELLMILSLTAVWSALLATALYDLVRRKRTRGEKVRWGVVIVLFSIIGPLTYFVLGRETSGDSAVRG